MRHIVSFVIDLLADTLTTLAVFFIIILFLLLWIHSAAIDFHRPDFDSIELP